MNEPNYIKELQDKLQEYADSYDNVGNFLDGTGQYAGVKVSDHERAMAIAHRKWLLTQIKTLTSMLKAFPKSA